MRVSLFGLFLRCTSLMGPWPKRIQSLLLMISFILDFPVSWILCYTVHICIFICVLTLLSPVLDSCVPPGSPPGFVSYSPGEFHWLPWILMSRSWSPERVDFPCCCSEWRSGSVDLLQAFQSSILPDPLWVSRVFLYKLVSALLLILVHFHVLYTVHTCTFPCIPAFAHTSDMIFM